MIIATVASSAVSAPINSPPTVQTGLVSDQRDDENARPRRRLRYGENIRELAVGQPTIIADNLVVHFRENRIAAADGEQESELNNRTTWSRVFAFMAYSSASPRQGRAAPGGQCTEADASATSRSSRKSPQRAARNRSRKHFRPVLMAIARVRATAGGGAMQHALECGHLDGTEIGVAEPENDQHGTSERPKTAAQFAGHPRTSRRRKPPDSPGWRPAESGTS